ncbi:MAG: four-helix bundle copper-binding protein [Longimicrobiaceae bacterium]
MQTREMLDTHPRPSPMDRGALAECIDACFECLQSCTTCADACLGEATASALRRCIRLNLDCADVCDATGRILSRLSEPDPGLIQAQLRACMEACRLCAAECEKHAGHHEHCRVCAEVCRRCEDACRSLLATA